ncbi:MAG: HD domain-containing protein [Ruminococcus sp.]|nr:HD domain-containing protein [Ruminococcus sp.]
MKLNLTNLLYALSDALDMVESDMIGVQSSHGKHVAYLSYLMRKRLGLVDSELEDFTGCALLHDNAFSEYASEEFYGGSAVDTRELRRRVELLNENDYIDFISGSTHSIAGEENIRLLPFSTDIRNIILHHHENADGTGPMGRMSYETNFKSQIVHLADTIDVTTNIMTISEKEFNRMRYFIHKKGGTFFSRKSADLFLDTVTYDDILYLQEYSAEVILRRHMPSKEKNYSDEQIKNIAAFFARIVDCKSSFVRNHSLGVAEKAERMSRYYGFSSDKCIRMYLAGALHDIGKLIIENDILEKPDKLTENEFARVKNHAYATYQVLHKAEGLSDITEWASNHHEKLNGSGYPLGLTADKLNFESRIMTCSDIYQALTETRPYKNAMTHGQAIDVMRDMVRKNEIDGQIVEDMNKIL